MQSWDIWSPGVSQMRCLSPDARHLVRGGVTPATGLTGKSDGYHLCGFPRPSCSVPQGTGQLQALPSPSSGSPLSAAWPVSALYAHRTRPSSECPQLPCCPPSRRSQPDAPAETSSLSTFRPPSARRATCRPAAPATKIPRRSSINGNRPICLHLPSFSDVSARSCPWIHLAVKPDPRARG